MIHLYKPIEILYAPWGSYCKKLKISISNYFDIEDMSDDKGNIRTELSNNYTTDMGGIFHIELEE